MNTFLEQVKNRVAKRDAERYLAYSKQDKKKGHLAGAALYAKAAKHQLSKIK